MIISMTGFGQAKIDYNQKSIYTEIKSLNARTTEIRCKMPDIYREYEMEVRRKIMENLSRGKFEITIAIDGLSDVGLGSINKEAFRKYYKEISALRYELDIVDGDIVQAILRIPNVVAQLQNQVDEEEWKQVELCIERAIENLQNFRVAEGAVLKADLQERLQQIEINLKAVEPYENQRLDKLRDRLRRNLEDFVGNANVDQNRFEQEIIYYIEKLDINEEKVRLAQHCTYFREQLENDDEQIGRKLSFISQEMGREINTMGAKAQDSDIQQHVVIMKDELEKLKEQLANIL
jgi:uncharacterized protein (TIGR00255 family)